MNDETVVENVVEQEGEKKDLTPDQISGLVMDELVKRYNVVGEFISSIKPDVDIKANALRALHESFLWAKEFVALTKFETKEAAEARQKAEANAEAKVEASMVQEVQPEGEQDAVS